ncbi:hypothetical protein HPB52_023665 [Rhipicephalus sanguineus]|uniref:Uncharacterized protein n=1 Tax=Rhipicephalus sanguineus TaxID=34632 RepID=A0A9D4QB41_RHISA|nr:hypothetical protein HPB52_023665 [Rhipicephalus sanguineus]
MTRASWVLYSASRMANAIAVDSAVLTEVGNKNASKWFTSKELVGKATQHVNSWVKTGMASTKEGNAELETHPIVTLIIGNVDPCHKFLQFVLVDSSLMVIREFGQQFLQFNCKMKY